MEKTSSRLARRIITALVILIAVVASGQFLVSRILLSTSNQLGVELEKSTETSKKVVDVVALQKSVQLNVVQVQQFLTDVSATRGQDGLDDGFSIAAENAELFDKGSTRAIELATDLGDLDMAESFRQVRASFPAYYEIGQAMAKAYVAEGPAGGNKMMASFDEQASVLSDRIDVAATRVQALLGRIDSENEALRAAISERTTTAKIIVWAVIAASTGLAIFTLLFIRMRLLKPLTTATSALRRLASGDDKVEMAGADQADEIGDLARAFADFKRASTKARETESAAQALRAEQSAGRDRQAVIEQARAEDLRAFVGYVEAGFNALSAGDLTARMNETVAPEFEPIRVQFNGSIASLEETIGSVVGAVGTIRIGLNQISIATADLAQRTEQQAASLEQTVAALGDVTAAVNETAGSAEQAQGSAATAQKNAHKGGEIVGHAVEAMSAIEQSSDKIGKIIGVIDEIAFQTNLLALNAGVEAARAGEAGRGFAVVAQEVRGLAQRSAEAAKEIKGLIATSTEHVTHGVELVTASGQSLGEIVGQVATMSGIVTVIASSAREQAVSLREVSTAANQMDKVTQQNAAMVEETTAAAQSLTSETEQLAAMVERFKTKAGTSAKPTPARRPAASRSRPTSPAGQAVPQMRSQGKGGAAAKPAAAGESWEEF